MKIDKLKSLLIDPIHSDILYYVNTIDRPDPDLLRAYFHLIPNEPYGELLLIQSRSLKSLIPFYHNLITNTEIKACEIINLSSSAYGLLKGKKQHVDFPSEISHQWYGSEKLAKNIYSN